MSPNHIALAAASKTNFACISRNLIRLRFSCSTKTFRRSLVGRRMMRPICDLSGKKQSVERERRIEISGDPKVIILKFSNIDARRRENKSHRTETCTEIRKRILPHSDGLFSPRKAGCHEISIQERQMQNENENLTNDFNESSGLSGEKRVGSMNLAFDKSDFELNLDLGAKSLSSRFANSLRGESRVIATR